MTETIRVNDRPYRLPTQTTVVMCVDGFDPAYLEQGIRDRILPTLARLSKEGFAATADAAVPTFTNPNNTSIVTGAPPAIHGISGNYYLDRASGREVMVTDAHLLRCETILGRMSHAGVKVAAVTAKDKLCKMLGHNLKGIAFSSQLADTCTIAENGITDVEALVGRPKPDMYSPDLSLFVLDAGLKLIERGDAQLLYLSLSDLIQHAHAPGESEADEFHSAIDRRVKRMIDLGALVGITADHGMNEKTLPDGSPKVVFLEDELNARFGDGAVRVICPISDPFVRHHGALGSFVRVYDMKGVGISRLMDAAAKLPGVELVMDGPSAARRFELPLDREGDFVAIAQTDATIGAKRSEHDLSGLAGHRLRSHGGISEQPVPFIVSAPLNPEYAAIANSRRLRNFDIFDFVLNGTQ
jgi:phosphonoacetate hydrolase